MAAQRYFCTECEQVKPASNFSPHTSRRTGYQSLCIDCRAWLAQARLPRDLEREASARAARREAEQDLIDRHVTEFARLYVAARRRHGITPRRDHA